MGGKRPEKAPAVLLNERGLVESPRWHDGCLWFADWTAGEILSLASDGAKRIEARAAAPPLSFDFAPNGTMFVVAAGADHLLCQQRNGQLSPFASFGKAGGWNEIVIDAAGRIYVNGPQLLLVRPDGSVEVQAEGFAFPNGMAISGDGRTLVCAESHGRRLTAFAVGQDGRLSDRRIWATLPGPPDGICFDAEGAIWYADVPNACCRRVREGGELLQEIKLDRGAFACMLGGGDRRTLFITAARWFGMDRIPDIAGTGQVQAIDVAVSGAGWPYG
ncbi:MAG TPA: SMP-30/gluconolactonase/LRE family protein [Pseudolabrys sp.]|nr:SMP-30/gluconolactonase/LRE family protein [Pseudolabrys sp.]